MPRKQEIWARCIQQNKASSEPYSSIFSISVLLSIWGFHVLMLERRRGKGRHRRRMMMGTSKNEI
jgi:hypothetical protein